MTMKLKAEIRNKFNRSATRQLRLAGKVPAVVYGKNREPIPVVLEHKEMLKALKHPNVLLELEVPGHSLQRVVLHAVQRHPLDHTIQAVDFHQVDLTERVKTNIHIAPLPDPDGKSIPYQMFLHELHVNCLPDRIPGTVELDMTPLRQGRVILVRDLPIPEGVQVLNRPDEVVASPFHPAGEAAVQEAG